ncbi:exocyst complex component 1-like [Conger conger]|uniref:exocyst complex component 1-like n=1 Tax=Conger conger TaxID=82655 RepID=UPI002A5ACCC8|nr:exocyst complex component 1-like [Conger conger]
MSSLLKEEMQRVLFTPEGQQLKEFIEIAEIPPGRHFLCVSVNKVKAVQISVVKNLRTNRLDTFQRTEEWLLKDLVLLDGRDPEADEPQFVMHFDAPRSMEAVSCAAKYSLARSLVSLSTSHHQTDLKLANFDWTYIHPTSVYSNRGDCMVLLQICFYAANLVCLSLCPIS